LHSGRIAIIVVASGGLGIGCLSLLGGCGDESRTSGTQVQISPADKAIDDAARGEMKRQRGAIKKEQLNERLRKRR